MYTGLIAKRYATALADFAAGNGEEQQVRDEVERLVVFYRNDRRMRDTLFSPVLLHSDQKGLPVVGAGWGGQPHVERFSLAGVPAPAGKIPELHAVFLSDFV